MSTLSNMRWWRDHPSLIGMLLVCAALAVGLGAWKISLTHERAEACKRERVLRTEIANNSETIRRIVVAVVRASQPVATMNYEQRVLHEELKASVKRLTLAKKRLANLVCG